MIHRLRAVPIYLLLALGSLVFIWPFLWMAATSAKLDREMFADTLRLWPQRPIPRLHSPYLDDRFFADVNGPRFREAAPMIEQQLTALSYQWPRDLDRAECRCS